MKKVAYSWSALESYFGGPTHGGCPLAYRLIRLDKIPRETSEPLIIGRDCHQLAADYLTNLIKTGQSTDWEGAAAMLTPSTHPDVAEIFTRFYENFILPPIENPGIEKQIAFNRSWQPVEWFAKDAFFRMVLDFTFMQGGLVVVKDFKTNRAIIDVDPENIPLQLKIYAWGALQTIFPRAQEVLLQLDFMRYGVMREVLLSPDMLESVPSELEKLVATIESDKNYAPTPGSYCSWCGVQSHCSVMAGALVPVEILAPATREQAEKAATLLLAVREMNKMITGRLKAYVQEYGEVRVGDQIYGPSVSTSYDLDPREVTEHLLGEGLEVDQVWGLLNLTKTNLERGLKKLKRKDLLDAILAGAPSKPVEKIGFQKPK